MLTLSDVRKRSVCFEVFVLKINYPLLYDITTDPEICPNPPGHENPVWHKRPRSSHAEYLVQNTLDTVCVSHRQD